MKYLVAVFVLFAVHVSAETDAVDKKLDGYSVECAKSLSISIDKLGRYQPLDSTSDIENKRNAQCFSKCIAEKMGIFNEDDGFSVDAYIKTSGDVVHEAEIRQRFEKCAKENPRNSENICQWYSDGINCLQKFE